MLFACNVKYIKICLISDFWQDDRWELWKIFFLLSLSKVYMVVEKRILLEATLKTFLAMWSHGL